MKFKVGDKVKFVGDYKNHSIYNGKKLEDFVKENKNFLYITKVCTDYVQVKGSTFWCFYDGELELAEYTYEDLKKSPIGTKITFANGEEMVKCSTKRYENGKRWRAEDDFVRMEDKIRTLGKIIKIEEPEYRIVHEIKPEILDDVEKRYLIGVIRPFRDKVTYIKKFVYSSGNAKIDINVENWYICLPIFPKNQMYKNMEDDKEYSLEELGL